MLEVDEYCHRYYERSCEVTRILELHEQCRGLPLIMIRFNPKPSLLGEMKDSLQRALCRPCPEVIEIEFVGYPEHLEYDIVDELKQRQ